MSNLIRISYKPRMMYCPLCGGTPKLMQRHYEATKAVINRKFYIICGNCHAETKEYSSLPVLLAAWNKREADRCQTVFI